LTLNMRPRRPKTPTVEVTETATATANEEMQEADVTTEEIAVGANGSPVSAEMRVSETEASPTTADEGVSARRVEPDVRETEATTLPNVSAKPELLEIAAAMHLTWSSVTEQTETIEIELRD